MIASAARIRARSDDELAIEAGALRTTLYAKRSFQCAGSAKGDELRARNLVRAAIEAGVEHAVYLSIVGAERIPMTRGIDRAMFGYVGSKLAAERISQSPACPGPQCGPPSFMICSWQWRAS